MSQFPDAGEGLDCYDDARSRRSFRAWGIILVLGALAAVWYFHKPSSSMASWVQGFDQGIDTAAKTGKPMLVLFTADWCGPCKNFKHDTLGDDKVARRLEEEFTCVIVDLSERGGDNDRIARECGVLGIPALVRFDQAGRMINKISGAVPPEILHLWLDGKSFSPS